MAHGQSGADETMWRTWTKWARCCWRREVFMLMTIVSTLWRVTPLPLWFCGAEWAGQMWSGASVS